MRRTYLLIMLVLGLFLTNEVSALSIRPFGYEDTLEEIENYLEQAEATESSHHQMILDIFEMVEDGKAEILYMDEEDAEFQIEELEKQAVYHIANILDYQSDEIYNEDRTLNEKIQREIESILSYDHLSRQALINRVVEYSAEYREDQVASVIDSMDIDFQAMAKQDALYLASYDAFTNEQIEADLIKDYLYTEDDIEGVLDAISFGELNNYFLSELEEAKKDALNYLDYLNLSRQELRNHLLYDKYSLPVANAVIDAIDVDWAANAIAQAEDILSYDAGISHVRLYNELVSYRNYSIEEAQAAVQAVADLLGEGN